MLKNSLDPRVNVYRPDLADISLQSTVSATTYVEPTLRQCLSGVIPLLSAPHVGARLISQIRYGEFVDVFEEREDGFLWVQNRADHYVGYVPSGGRWGDKIAMLSNRVNVLRTFVYPEPDIKSPPTDELTLGSFASVARHEGRFLELIDGGFVVAQHVLPTEQTITEDYVFTAGRLLHIPYLWGGRTPKGIDCSGLVQLALEMAGISVPRDCDQQCSAIGSPFDEHWRDRAWRRGDVVFMKEKSGGNHIGLMTGLDHIIHANATTMSVTVDLLADVVDRGIDIIAVSTYEDVMKY